MAFNFNWSPLTADAEFYARARDLLTTALNKSPKPPIIVDDILVTEFNLGSVPPELEILEIGDLADDRFRGIFKMSYSGDAYLTLRTRVQANPLNTYLSSKPTFTSPQPLAAAAGLTIPLSITLSEIKLSGFVIVVFSKQKGLTLVFRNDPLESLKVSSTFDSIQFVRDYLQKTIEGQLRTLMMEELPAIIHRLSLRLFCPDQLPREEEAPKEADNEAVVDPFANLPEEAVDSTGHVLDANEIASMTFERASELQSLFSQKNLLRLAALSDSHRTLSLFTPGIRDVMFRAWTGPMEQYGSGPSTPLATPSLSRMQSQVGSTTYTFTDASMDQGSSPSRPSTSGHGSYTSGLSLGMGRPRTSRKKKTRVVNLRRSKTGLDASSETAEMGDSVSASESTSFTGPNSEPVIPVATIPEEAEEVTQPTGPPFSRGRSSENKGLPSRPALNMDIYEAPASEEKAVVAPPNESNEKVISARQQKALEAMASAKSPFNLDRPRPARSDTSSVILEQAWIMKMAGEIARRVYDEKQRRGDIWVENDDPPPPAYQATR
ncbi:hypothetical protein DL764_001231 [Monosporascus ibericus]|uniref:Mitochondrial distribution and morphology protein 34 n=1 Tax=Monosporascus ibericus TaxID=155417 RepID=A0A4Q4TQG0_9PEZI|nr:hypothetical protein DL764_001231 [Monosporascus ibericus]